MRRGVTHPSSPRSLPGAPGQSFQKSFPGLVGDGALPRLPAPGPHRRIPEQRRYRSAPRPPAHLGDLQAPTDSAAAAGTPTRSSSSASRRAGAIVPRSAEGAQAGGQGWRASLLIGGDRPAPGPAPARPHCPHPARNSPAKAGPPGCCSYPPRWKPEGPAPWARAAQSIQSLASSSPDPRFPAR